MIGENRFGRSSDNPTAVGKSTESFEKLPNIVIHVLIAT